MSGRERKRERGRERETLVLLGDENNCNRAGEGQTVKGKYWAYEV
jgi:hypothetical protein